MNCVLGTESPMPELLNRVNFFRSLWGLREQLRSVWKARGTRERERYIREMRRLYVLHSRALSSPHLPLLQSNLEGVSTYDGLDVGSPRRRTLLHQTITKFLVTVRNELTRFVILYGRGYT